MDEVCSCRQANSTCLLAANFWIVFENLISVSWSDSQNTYIQIRYFWLIAWEMAMANLYWPTLLQINSYQLWFTNFYGSNDFTKNFNHYLQIFGRKGQNLKTFPQVHGSNLIPVHNKCKNISLRPINVVHSGVQDLTTHSPVFHLYVIIVVR